jgi:hypothetical protein
MFRLNKSFADELFVPNDKPRELTDDEVKELVSRIYLPYKGVKDVIDEIDRQLKSTTRKQTKGIKIYGCMVPFFINYVHNTFMKSLEDPGAPIGPRGSDAVGQQATQNLLNTFHQAGSSKSGGPSGIGENITIAKKRTTSYSVFGFWNEYLLMEEVMDYTKTFTGITVADLASSILPLEIDIDKHLGRSKDVTTTDSALDLANSGVNWWYDFADFNSLYRSETRTAIRIRLDVMKLFEFQITTTDVANVLRKYDIPISTHRTGKDNKEKFTFVPIASPTFIGIIDVFLISEDPGPRDMDRDFFLTSAITAGEFKNVYVSGIPGIRTLFPVMKKTLSLVRAITESRVGAELHLTNPRFHGVPVSKLVRLLKTAGLELIVPNLEYHSHHIVFDNRKRLRITATSINSEFGEFNYVDRTYTGRTYADSIMAAPNPFFREESRETTDYEYRVMLLTKRPEPRYTYPIPYDGLNTIEDVEFVIEIANRVMNGADASDDENELIMKFLGIDDNGDIRALGSGDHRRNFAGFPVQLEGNRVEYVGIVQYSTTIIEITVNTDYVNSGANVCSLDSILNTYFSEPIFCLPNDFRLPKVDILETEPEPGETITVVGHLLFRDDLDPYDEDGNRIVGDAMSRLQTLIAGAVDDRRLTDHVYGETQGVALESLCSHELIDPRTTYCNDYYMTFHVFGIEGLYGLLASELIEIVNKGGYINTEYPRLIAALTTGWGINPFTSLKSLSQKKNTLAQVTFDNAPKFIEATASKGMVEPIHNVSASIFIGTPCRLGAGYADVSLNEVKIMNAGAVPESQIGNELTEDELFYENMLRPLEVRLGKFPTQQWVIKNYVSHDIVYYLQNGIRNMAAAVLEPVPVMDGAVFLMYEFPVIEEKPANGVK